MIVLEKKITKRIKITAEQFQYIRDNKNLSSEILAIKLGISINSITHNKYLIKKLDIPKAGKNFFDVDEYTKQLNTI